MNTGSPKIEEKAVFLLGWTAPYGIECARL
jgi:hypothetical protein